MITALNRLVRRLKQNGGRIERLLNIFTDYLWLRTTFFWEFDLHRNEAPWQRFRDNDDGNVSWNFATVRQCRDWSQSGSDGFSSQDCELLIRQIDLGNFVLTGTLNGRADRSQSDLPDCYAICAFGFKPMAHRRFFQMKPGEGTIRTVYTRTASRGRGLATRLYAEICCITGEKGMDKLFVDIDGSNVPSIRAAEKAGAVRLKDTIVYELRFFKRSYLFCRGSLRKRFVSWKQVTEQSPHN